MGRKLHHTTFEEPDVTLGWVRTAGWKGAGMNTAESLGEKYGVPNYFQAQIIASK